MKFAAVECILLSVLSKINPVADRRSLEQAIALQAFSICMLVY